MKRNKSSFNYSGDQLTPNLKILFEDDQYVAIDKPSGLLVHKTNIAKEEGMAAVQLLRDQLDTWVYPLHRIDRPTSGILLFAKSSEAASLLQPLFPTDAIHKEYLALVRGYPKEQAGEINQPLKKKLVGELQDAKTIYETVANLEIPFSSSAKYATSRYSLIKAYPKTGRMHQIRRHMAHARHYIIGDTTHGNNKENKFFRDQYDLKNMLLHASKLTFEHPIDKRIIEISAPLPDHFLEILSKLGYVFNE